MSQVEFSKRILNKLHVHYESIPLFYSTMSQTLNRINLFCKIFVFSLIDFCIIYILVRIFPPHSTIESDILIRKCSFIVTRSKKSIETG